MPTKITHRFLILAAAGTTAVAAVSFVGAVGLQRLQSQVDTLAEQALPAEAALRRLDAALLTSRVQSLAGALHDPQNPVSKLHDHPLDLHLKAIDRALADLQEASTELVRLAGTDSSAQTRWRQLAEAVSAYVEKVGRPLAAELAAGRWEEVAAGVTRSNAQYMGLKALLDAASKSVSAAASAQAVQAANSARNVTLALAAIGVVGLALLAALLWTDVRALQRSLRMAEKVGERLHRLEFVPVAGSLARDEIGTLVERLNSAVSTLAESFAQIRDAAQAVAAGAGEIAAGNQDLSARTESQASSVQQTASATEQLNATVQNNAQAAREAREIASSAAQVADAGAQAAERVVATMAEIAERSRRIAEIITVIDSIAFQTNILALNAAVEAARAGEQGRGFAVVAAEVRNLAQRSAQAARETKQLIEDSVTTVQRANGEVNQAGDTIRQLVQRVQSVNGLIDQIATASSEQAIGIQQINQAVSQLESVTQQNAALVEQAAAASARLSSEAQRAETALSRFRVASAAA